MQLTTSNDGIYSMKNPFSDPMADISFMYNTRGCCDLNALLIYSKSGLSMKRLFIIHRVIKLQLARFQIIKPCFALLLRTLSNETRLAHDST